MAWALAPGLCLLAGYWLFLLVKDPVAWEDSPPDQRMVIDPVWVIYGAAILALVAGLLALAMSRRKWIATPALVVSILGLSCSFLLAVLASGG